MSSRPRRPARGWYALGPVLLVAAAALAILVAPLDVLDRIERVPTVAIPGTMEVEITAPGRYRIFLEHTGGGAVRTEDLATRGVHTTLTAVHLDDGAPVAIQAPRATITYTFGAREGVMIGVMEAARAGTYRVTATEALTPVPAQLRVDVEDTLGPGLVLPILGALAVLGAGVLAGILAVVVVAIRRAGDRRAAADPADPAAPPGGAHPWEPPPPLAPQPAPPPPPPSPPPSPGG